MLRIKMVATFALIAGALALQACATAATAARPASANLDANGISAMHLSVGDGAHFAEALGHDKIRREQAQGFAVNTDHRAALYP